MDNDLQCPKCKSNQVIDNYHSMRCLNCGLSEGLYDYPAHDPSWELPDRPEVALTSELEHNHQIEHHQIVQHYVIEEPSKRRLNQLEGNLVSLRDTLKQHVNETKPIKKYSKVKSLETLETLESTRKSLESLETA